MVKKSYYKYSLFFQLESYLRNSSFFTKIKIKVISEFHYFCIFGLLKKLKLILDAKDKISK